MRSLVLSSLLAFSVIGVRDAAEAASKSTAESRGVAVTVESTLKTSGDHIRQFVFDGDPDTFFASDDNATAKDSFTMTFDKPVTIQSISVATGRPNGEDKLESGELEISHDGGKFESVAEFSDGAAKYVTKGRQAVAIRIKPKDDLKHPLVIREIKIDSGPQLATFKYPVEFVLDYSDAPEMKEWMEQCAKICERQYTMINEQLPSEGFKPAHLVKMSLKTSYRGVAATGGTNINGSVKYFKDHPKDFGAMVHETVHVVQAYRRRNGNPNPGWLVEGIADYIRFFIYEPGKAGRMNPDRVHYNQPYRPAATFLNFVTEKYDKDLVKKLNAAMRQGKYKDDLFKDYTGKTVEELDKEWIASLKG
jgi:basic secretory peptidase family protein/F5/8 type C domain-containing protein